jgi:hypothetical protein
MLGKRPENWDNVFRLFDKPGRDEANFELQTLIDKSIDELRTLQKCYQSFGTTDTASSEAIANYLIYRFVGGRE